MVALAVVVLAIISFGLVGGLLGYEIGFDEGFEAALKCYEEEMKNAYIQTETE